MLSSHEVKIHKVYNLLCIYAVFIISFTFMHLWVQETPDATWYLLRMKAELDNIKKRSFRRKEDRIFYSNISRMILT